MAVTCRDRLASNDDLDGSAETASPVRLIHRFSFVRMTGSIENSSVVRAGQTNRPGYANSTWFVSRILGPRMPRDRD
jgi:hypothetical protein